MLPTIEFTPQERAEQAPHPDTVVRGAAALRMHGCVVLRDLFAAELIAGLRDDFLARHDSLFRSARPADSSEVGGLRFMTPLALAGAFHTPELYAHPFVLPILRAVMGDDIVLGVLNVVTSLPGAPVQHVHRDGPPLFNAAVNRMLPAYAITFFVPLVEFNESTGTTRCFPGTHIDTDADPATAPFIDPDVPVGSCLLLDYRLYHQGRANRSALIRPLCCAVYQQPWFKDYRNHATIPFLRLADDDYARIPEEHRNLLRWTEHYRPGLY